LLILSLFSSGHARTRRSDERDSAIEQWVKVEAGRMDYPPLIEQWLALRPGAAARARLRGTGGRR